MQVRVSIAFLVALSAPSVVAQNVVNIREATATGPQGNAQAGIQATIIAFRGDLGDPNNGNAVGSQGTGRREASLDGGDNDAAPARLPADFFNAVAPRGAVFTGDARLQFQVSADATPSVPGTPDQFGNVNATYPTAFSAFSSPRIISALNNNVFEVEFFVPGTRDPATVSGFGAVFTDVDTADVSMIEYFDVQGELLFSRAVLATAGNESLSFLGVKFDAPVVRRVRITAGSAPLGPNDVTQGGTEDIVVLDDLIYGEPIAIPDTDGDGVLDPFDGCPEDANKTAPGVCGCGESETDSDADGVPDCLDGCPDDANKLAPGLCGCGMSEADADGDGVPDCEDGCPDNADKLDPGACGCDAPDADADSDGVADCVDGCPEDPDKRDPGACGCGVAENDSDDDGVPDCLEQPSMNVNANGAPANVNSNGDDDDNGNDNGEDDDDEDNENGDDDDDAPLTPVGLCGACGGGAAFSSGVLMLGLFGAKARIRRRNAAKSANS